MKNNILLSICIIIIGTCIYTFKPGIGGIYPPCPFYILTGLYCPGCGSLRGIYSLLHGDIAKAFDYNPLMVLSMPFIIFLLVSNSHIRISGRIVRERNILSTKVYKILLVTIFSFWILRNIHVYPFAILAP